MQTLDLGGKTVVITGGCGAIGLVIARMLADQGARLAVNDVVSDDEAARLLTSAAVARPTVSYVRADVTRPEAVADLFDRVEAVVGSPDVVCCHAGMTVSAPVVEYPLEGFDALVALNVRGSFIVAREAARRWIARGAEGHLIFTSSWVADVPWPDITPYSASKAALKAMMRGFARELAPHGIRANAVAPGIVAVGMARQQWDSEPAYRARAARAIPLGYMQPPESVAQAFLFLCSDLASYMTGAVLLVDGGASLYPMDPPE